MHTAAQTQMKLEWLLTDECIKKMWHAYLIECHSALNKEDNPATCNNMERPTREFAKIIDSVHRGRY